MCVSLDAKVEDYGPFEPDKESVRQDPLTLPDQFVWDTVDIYCEDSVSQFYIYLYICMYFMYRYENY